MSNVVNFAERYPQIFNRAVARRDYERQLQKIRLLTEIEGGKIKALSQLNVCHEVTGKGIKLDGYIDHLLDQVLEPAPDPKSTRIS